MTKGKLLAVATVMALMGVTSVYGIPAFPGAEGGGAASVGGRMAGSQVIEVTNLNDSGPGSLREAIRETSGPRIVVFRVSGTIDLQGPMTLWPEHSYLTIAGQTAPDGGITIRYNELKLRAHDIVIQYVRFRLGKQNGTDDWADQSGSCLYVLEGGYNVIVDHCSFSWSSDELTNAWPSYDSSRPASNHITWQWNLLAEGLTGYPCGSSCPSGSHACAILVGTDNSTCLDGMTHYSVHHNLMMNNSHRMPLMKSQDAQVINNIVYNWSKFASMSSGGIDIDYVNNKYVEGPESFSCVQSDHEYEVHHRKMCVNDSSWEPGLGPNEDPTIYISGNTGPFNTNQWDMVARTCWWSVDQHPMSTSLQASDPLDVRQSPYVDYPITIDPTSSLDSVLLSEVGASHRLDENGNWVANRDSVDQRLVNEYSTGTGSLKHCFDDITYPTIAPGTPYTDSDQDGMPDAWEVANGLNPNDYNDFDGDADGDGYWNIEEFLHGGSTAPPCTVAPDAPTNLTLDDVTETTVAMSWTASGGCAATHYNVYRDGGGSPIGTTAVTSYTDTTVSAGTVYSYTVSGENSYGESGQSSALVVTTPTPDTQAPSVPTGLAVDSVTASTVALSWTDSTDDTAVTGYRVFRDGGSIGTVSGAAYTDGGLACCTTYSYSVSAFDGSANESSACTPVTADTPGESQSSDLSGDGNVDIADLAVLATNWLGTGCGVTGDLLLDQAVNLLDFDVLAGDWGAASVDNLIENGSFESGTDVWGNPAGPAAGNGSVDTTVARTGSASFKAVGGSDYAYLDQTPTLTPSTSYTMSCWIKVDAVDGGNARCRPVQLDPSTIQYWGTPISGTSDWTKSEVTFTTESDYAGGRVDLLWDHDTGTAWFDDAILVEN